MAYFDDQCLEALQKIGTELQKIRETMENRSLEQGNKKSTKNSIIMERICEPKVGEIVFQTSEDGKSFFPCKIIDGSFYRNGRVSNSWKWINLITGEEEGGYGGFYKVGY